jgi:hypothetical protein
MQLPHLQYCYAVQPPDGGGGGAPTYLLTAPREVKETSSSHQQQQEQQEQQLPLPAAMSSTCRHHPRSVVLFLEGDQIVDDAMREDLGQQLLDPMQHLRIMQDKWPADCWVGV